MQIRQESGHVLQYSVTVAALFVLAVAQPLLDLLRRNTEFFVARKSDPPEIVALALLLCLVFPSLLALILALLLQIHQKAGRIFHHAIFLILTTLFTLPMLKSMGILPAPALLLLSIGIGAVLLFVVVRYASIASLMKWLSVFIIIVPFVFLTSKPVTALLRQNPFAPPVLKRVSSTAPIVFLILDELPLVSLLDAEGKIDAKKYPNFAQFQKDSVWFRNATTVADGTPESIGAILSGLYPANGRLPTLQDYPRNLFTLFSGSYDIKAVEHVSRMSPRPDFYSEQESIPQRWKLILMDLAAIYLHIVTPDELRGSLPSINQTWGNFWMEDSGKDSAFRSPYVDRGEQYKKFLTFLSQSERPTLYFQHIFLPHVPWAYLPDGKEYDYRSYGPMGVEGMSVLDEIWTRDAWLVERGYQRHLLQVSYVDWMIGALVDRLKVQNMYDSALIVITADHGSSYREGDRVRTLTSTNYSDILPVPVLMKLPGKKEERIIDKNFQTIDILPTAADALGIQLPFQVDGASAFREGPIRTHKRALRTIFSKNEWLEFPADLTQVRAESAQRKIRLFGSGDAESLYHPPGIQAAGFNTVQKSIWTERGVTFELKNAGLFQNVDLNSDFLPIFITGRALFESAASEPVLLGVWVNGVFRGVTRTFLPDANVSGWLRTLWLSSSSGRASNSLRNIHGFGIIVSKDSFRSGRNDIKIRMLATDSMEHTEN